ncbi:MAG: glycosyltransferase family 2 protein [Thermoanaerobaculia bacterium]|nr:glycosyltransferase family 2 protein [Thermoanaerobaculia bacterium]
MTEALSSLALVVYYVVLATLALYGLHRLGLLVLFLRARRRLAKDLPTIPEDDLPSVTVQLPIFNELYVAERLIDAVCDLDYPRDRLEIQVLDDSTDDTREVVAAAVERQRQRGIDIHHVRRADRRGFKAGALAHGLESARGELLAVFDADFVPRADFLRRTVGGFADPRVGMVQARWEHLNRSFSLLTRIQAIFLDGHFAIEHLARAGSGRFFNFNGTAGVWRRRAIEESGGWTQDTLTEDLDLSYRAQLAGWRFVFLPTVTAPAELPVDVYGFKRQQYRWAKGSIQTARKLLGRLLRAPVGWRVKLEGVVHLTNNAAYLLMILLSLLVFPAMVVRHNRDLHWLTTLDVALFSVATVPIGLFYLASQLAVRPRRPGGALHLVSLMALGIGLSVNNCRAVVAGLFEEGGTFERTPKYRIESRRDAWHRKRYRARRDVSYGVEGLLALYFAAALYFSWQLEMWASLPFLFLFFQGYTYVFALSVSRHLALRRLDRRAPPPDRSPLPALPEH